MDATNETSVDDDSFRNDFDAVVSVSLFDDLKKATYEARFLAPILIVLSLLLGYRMTLLESFFTAGASNKSMIPLQPLVRCCSL
jgi:hypothetical protein